MNPEKFYRISQTPLSIARYYGGCTYNNDYYIYNPTDDTLTRQDVIKKEKNKFVRRTLEQQSFELVEEIKNHIPDVRKKVKP